MNGGEIPGLNTRRACHSIKGKAARAMLALSGRPFVAQPRHVDLAVCHSI